MRGSFIVLEGLDRTGKTTQLEKLIKNLQELSIPVEEFHFPFRSTAIGQKIDAYLQKKVSYDDWHIHELFALNRAEMMDNMREILSQGKTIICSRYAFSGVAYSAAKGMDFNRCLSADAGVLAPDLVLF
ncbi:hypothetical protein GEMRC1_011811 [Eukaryota sp. GEM-RC1]